MEGVRALHSTVYVLYLSFINDERVASLLVQTGWVYSCNYNNNIKLNHGGSKGAVMREGGTASYILLLSVLNISEGWVRARLGKFGTFAMQSVQP